MGAKCYKCNGLGVTFRAKLVRKGKEITQSEETVSRRCKTCGGRGHFVNRDCAFSCLTATLKERGVLKPVITTK